MTTIADLVDDLMPQVPGCLAATVHDALRWAQRELCAKGSAWVVSDGPVVVGADTQFAEVDVPSGAEALRIVRLLQGGRELTPGLDYRQTGSNAVEFLRFTPSSSALLGALACKPARGRDMPPELLGRWDEAIKDGARSQLLMLPFPWRDPQLAEHYRRKFLDAQTDAHAQSYSGHQSGSVRMQIRNFT